MLVGVVVTDDVDDEGDDEEDDEELGVTIECFC